MAIPFGIVFFWVFAVLAFFITLFIIHNYGQTAPIKLKWKEKFDAHVVDPVFKFSFPPRLNFDNVWSSEELDGFSKFLKLPSISLFFMGLKILSIISLIAMTAEFFAQDYVLLPQKPNVKLSTWASIVTTPMSNDWVLVKRKELPSGWEDLPQDTSFPLPSSCKSIDGESRIVAYNFAWNGHSQDSFGNCQSGCDAQENYTVTSQNYFAKEILYALIALACLFYFVFFTYSIPQSYDLARFEEHWQAEHIGRNLLLKRREGMSVHDIIREPILEYQFQANWLKRYYSICLWVATLFATAGHNIFLIMDHDSGCADYTSIVEPEILFWLSNAWKYVFVAILINFGFCLFVLLGSYLCECLDLQEFSERCGCCVKVAVCFAGVMAVGAIILGAGIGFFVQVNTLIVGPTLLGRFGAFYWIYSFISLLPFSAHLLYFETYVINIVLFLKNVIETCGKVFSAGNDLELGVYETQVKAKIAGAGVIEINFDKPKALEP